MFWTILTMSMLVSGIMIGQRLGSRAHSEPAAAPQQDSSRKGGAGVHAALMMLRLANAALAQGAHPRARLYAELAVSMLERSGASQVCLADARRVLREAQSVSQGIVAC